MWREYQFAVSGVGGKTERGGRVCTAGDGNRGGFVPGAGSGGRGADALVPARVGAFDCGHGTFHAGRGALDVAHRQLNRREDDKVAEALVRAWCELPSWRGHHDGGARLAGAGDERSGNRQNCSRCDGVGRRRFLFDAVHGENSVFHLAAAFAHHFLHDRVYRRIFV